MTDRAEVPASRVQRLRWISNLGAAAIVLVAIAAAGTQACSSPARNNGLQPGSSASSSGAGSGSSGASADDGGPGCATGPDGGCLVSPDGGITPCTGTAIAANKRIVRLTFNQITTSIGALLNFVPIPGADGGAATNIQTQLTTKYQIADAQHRTFPPLANPREGSVVTAMVYNLSDEIAFDTAQFVFTNFSAVTKCTGASPTDACAQAWLATFAQSAYRRPLIGTEAADLTAIYTADRSNGGSVQEATQYEVYAIFSAAQFLYRTEFGTDTGDMNAQAVAGPLAPYELASEISYFLTDGPPDAPLLSTAANGSLTTTATARTQVARIMGTAAAQANLEAAMIAYFAIPSIEAITIDTNLFPSWGDGMRNSMERESDLFLHDRLWGGKINEILTSKQSKINPTLAPVYGISPFPQPGSTPDMLGFAPTQLPANRSGIITQSGFLVARARPDAPSVVGRGLLINAVFICALNPSLPTDPATLAKVMSQNMDPNLTEGQKAAARASTAPCSGCHPGFDPYGLAIDNYDTLGAYRTVDPNGNPINWTTVTLPQKAGGATVAGAVDMATALASSGAFVSCMAFNVLTYALAESAGGSALNACSTADVAQAVNAGDGTFTSLVTEVAVSQTLAARFAGGT